MSQYSPLHEMWGDGMYGQYVEELIAGSFNDFAPYAGADVQRLSIVRQVGDEAQAVLQFDESGDFSVMGTHRQAGAVGFATSTIPGASSQHADVDLCVPLITARSAAAPSVRSDMETRQAILQGQALALPEVRFLDHRRGAQLVSGLHRFLGLGHGMSPYASCGQLEISGTLLPTVWSSGRQAYGVRCGPLAARLTALPYPPQLRAPALDKSTSSLMDETSQSALRRSKRPSFHHTIEAAACVPLPWPAQQPAPSERGGSCKPIHAPLACTLAVQHPLVMGDSLIGVSIQSDRVESVARRLGIPSETATDAHDPVRRVLRFPREMQPRSGTGAGASSTTTHNSSSAPLDEGITYAEAQTAFRALIVQTVASKSLQLSDAAEAATSTSTLGADGLYYSIVSHDGAWTSLPTLVGLSASFYRSLIRVSVAGIFHEGAADVEAAVVVDATPWMRTTPTLVKVGWNNLGRFALGVTSLFYEALAVTLGVHAMPGDGVRFGVEIAF